MLNNISKYFMIFILASLPLYVAAEPISVTCKYQVSVAANISIADSSKVDVTTNVKETDDMAFSFVMEEGENKACMQGNNGATAVNVIWGDEKVSFVEITGNGTVQVTAIYGKQRGRFASVHSRSTGGKGYEMPSQYYGVCEFK